MEDRQLRQVIVAALREIAPEITDDELDDHRPLRRQVDLDSIDWLRFLVDLHERLQVDIPEVDYPQLSSVAELIAYLRARLRLGGSDRHGQKSLRKIGHDRRCQIFRNDIRRGSCDGPTKRPDSCAQPACSRADRSH